MAKIKLTKKYRLLFDLNNEILVDYEATNPRTVTYCDRADVTGLEFDSKAAKDIEVAERPLKYKKDDPRYVEPTEDIADPAVKEPAPEIMV